MAYTAPTAADFKARFPVFAGLSDAFVDLLLGEAKLAVDDTWLSQGDYTTGVLYLAAHLAATDKSQATDEGDAGGSGGDIASESWGPMSVSYTKDASSTGDNTASQYSTTEYGRRFLSLLRKNKPAIVAV